MVKVLVAVRLDPGTVSELKSLAKQEGVSQGDFVTNSIALYKTLVLYKRELQGVEKQQESVNVIREKGEFVE
jgi:hypothetical protein